MPPGESHSVEINPKSFSEALSRISLIAQDGKEVGMVFSDGKEKEKKENEPMFAKGITLVGRNRKDKGSELYETQYTGKEDVPLAFDITYFQQALSFIDSETCSFEIFGSDDACIITSNDKHNVKYCIMPLLSTPSTATK